MGLQKSHHRRKFRTPSVHPYGWASFAPVGANRILLQCQWEKGQFAQLVQFVSKNLELLGIYLGNRRIGERDKEAVMKTL
jgi:hypothetical protein